MDYILLTPQFRLQLLSERLLEYEAQHFQQDTEARLAADIGDTATLTASTEARDKFAKLIEITRLDFADTQAEVNRLANPDATAERLTEIEQLVEN